jgi:chromosome segregation ATPase
VRRKSKTESAQKQKIVAPIQRRLDEVRPSPQEKEKSISVPEVSIKQLENEVDNYLQEFQSYVKRVKETSLSLEELVKLSKSGDIPENAYKLILDELGMQLSEYVEDVFKLRESLELAKAKAKLEWAKEKVSTPLPIIPSIESPPVQKSEDLRYIRAYSDVVQSDFFADETSRVRVSSFELQKWEDLISKIDSALSSLPIEDETGIIEQYLSIIKEKLTIGPKTAEVEKAFSLCQQRLSSIADRWAVIRRSQIEKIINLELESSRISDEIKELEIRYSVGEIAQQFYEIKISTLQTNLKRVENEVSNLRSSMDDMDMKIFRSSEISRENQ